MNVAVIGRGLIGGSVEKAARRAGHDVRIFAGRGPSPDVSGADVVVVATPLSAVVPAVEALAAGGTLKDGAAVVDIAGVKSSVCAALSKYAVGRWRFVGGHPMAGKERTGYANSCESLFDGASMILVPYPQTPEETMRSLSEFFLSLGFGRIVRTTPERHDEMISFTSQLCHLMSSAYVRDRLAPLHSGYSAGSFRDMVRVGAPDPAIWTELFLANAKPLAGVLGRYISRLEDFKSAIEAGDARSLAAMLEEGAAAKAALAAATAAAADPRKKETAT